MKIRPLRTGAGRRAIVAPDLDRYLNAKNVDLLVTDQVEAVRVRVARGLEVFGSRLRDSLRAVKNCVAASAVLLPLCLGAAWIAGRVLLAGERAGFWHWIGTIVAGAGAVMAAASLAGACADLLRLRRLVDRYRASHLDDLNTSEELLDYAEAVLREARALGAIPHRMRDEGRGTRDK